MGTLAEAGSALVTYLRSPTAMVRAAVDRFGGLTSSSTMPEGLRTPVTDTPREVFKDIIGVNLSECAFPPESTRSPS